MDKSMERLVGGITNVRDTAFNLGVETAAERLIRLDHCYPRPQDDRIVFEKAVLAMVADIKRPVNPAEKS